MQMHDFLMSLNQCLINVLIPTACFMKFVKSVNWQNFRTFLLRRVISFLSPLKYLLALSFCNSDFPDYLKLRKVSDQRSMRNYRPITVRSVSSILFEYAYLNRLASYLEKNKINTESQHGFRASRSTSTAVHSFYDTLTKLIDAG